MPLAATFQKDDSCETEDNLLKCLFIILVNSTIEAVDAVKSES